MERTECSSEEAIEAIAAGLPVGEQVLQHVESCQICQRLLDEVRENNRFLGTLARALAAPSPPTPTAEGPPLASDSIPGYTVGEEIHRGGHGIVYHAIQLRTKRPVAIKVLLRGATATRRQRQRLEHEAEIIASLRHPGIVTVYDAQYFEDGRYAFAMEYIDGKTLDRWAGDGAVANREQVLARLRLFASICDAVAFAHRHGVIHRDLKPANILIDEQNIPHILDFGIAKALQVEQGLISDQATDEIAPDAPSAPFVTLPGEFAGTPAFASPEQVSGDPGAIDTRTDVYSLGVILYRLLTGRQPYPCSGTLSEVVRHIKHAVPSAPSTTAPSVDADIDAIVLRALKKDKDQRYASVSALQNDVRRYLAGEAIEARSNSSWYVLRKSVRRHRTPALIAGVGVLLLTVFAIAMTLLYTDKRVAEAKALAQLRQRELMHGRSEVAAGRYDLGANLLWSTHLNPGTASDPPQRVLFGGAIEPLDSYWGLWELYSNHPRVATVDAHMGQIWDLAIAPDGSTVATAGEDGALRLWRMPGLELVAEHLHDSTVNEVRFTGDGRSLHAFILSESYRYLVYDVASAEEVASFPIEIEDLRRVRLSDDGSAAAAAGYQGRVHHLSLDGAPQARQVPTGPGYVEAEAFSRDGSLLATSIVSGLTGDIQSTISVWALPEIELVAQTIRERITSGLLFSPDGNALLWATNLAEIERWDFEQGAAPEHMGLSTSRILEMAWIGDDETKLLALDEDHTVRLIDLNRDEPVREVARASHIFRLLRTENEPTKLISGLADGQLTVWQVDSQPYRLVSSGDHRGCHEVAISPDNRTLAYAGGVADGFGIILSPLQGDRDTLELGGHTEMVSDFQFSADGSLLASASFDGTVNLWNVADASLLRSFADHAGRVSTVSISPDSSIIAFAGDGNMVHMHDLRDGNTRALKLDIQGDFTRIPSVAFHPNGRRLAVGASDGKIRLLDVSTGKLVNEFAPCGPGVIRTLCFSPDGALLASGGDENSIILTHLATNTHEALRAHPADVFALAFDAEGRVLISGDRFGGVMLWDVRERNQIASLPKHPEMLMSIAVSPDGMHLATSSAGSDPEVRLWDLATYRPHIAGNLEHHARRIAEALGQEPTSLPEMRAWAAEVKGQR